MRFSEIVQLLIHISYYYCWIKLNITDIYSFIAQHIPASCLARKTQMSTFTLGPAAQQVQSVSLCLPGCVYLLCSPHLQSLTHMKQCWCKKCILWYRWMFFPVGHVTDHLGANKGVPPICTSTSYHPTSSKFNTWDHMMKPEAWSWFLTLMNGLEEKQLCVFSDRFYNRSFLLFGEGVRTHVSLFITMFICLSLGPTDLLDVSHNGSLGLDVEQLDLLYHLLLPLTLRENHNRNMVLLNHSF